MNKTLSYILPTCVIVLIMVQSLSASGIDELDKPPEGAHKGQMLLGAFFSIGMVTGAPVDAEEKFLNGSSYSFSDSDITKELLVNHIAFSAGIHYEYIFIDHLGTRLTLKKTMVVQRTAFGAQYENWNETLYSDYTIQIGPTFHLTTRKQWDVTLNPHIGYSFAKYKATPVASHILSGYDNDEEITMSGLTYGSEINFTAYFTGGFYMTVGIDWTTNTINYDSKQTLTNPQTNSEYSLGNTTLHSFCFIMSAGYAFSN